MNFPPASRFVSFDDQILNEYTTEFQSFKLIENPFRICEFVTKQVEIKHERICNTLQGKYL